MKNLFLIIIALALAASMLFLFFTFTLPALKQDREQMVKEEMLEHNETLETIKQDFSSVLAYEDVSVQIGKNITITISGKYCDLVVELSRELQTLSLETQNKVEMELVGLAFACIGEGAALVIAVVWTCFIVKDIGEDISEAEARRKARKEAKKQTTDIEVIV